MIEHLHKIVTAQKHGSPVGITSICSANPFVIRAALEYARAGGHLVCIESTGRQVNQDGGYAGMKPDEFAGYLRQIAETVSLDKEKIILGGDHLGPGAWRFKNSDMAMHKARKLVRQCIHAGYRKLHLDPSMPCKDDMIEGRPGLALETIAERTADLCESAEAAAANHPENKSLPVYVVGAEVPAPGGEPGDNKNVRVSCIRDVTETIHAMARAFMRKGLEEAWRRCIALVVETGATFGPDVIYDYDPSQTRDLKRFIENEENMVFEAHSTDFQTRQALTAMVRDHFAILKVGPCLTFSVREVLYALASIEREWLNKRKGVTLSQLPEKMQKLMRSDPANWQAHYSGDEGYLRYIAAFGFSDRIRYYWSHPECSDAVVRLFGNLTKYGIPLPLVSQYLPDQFEAVREGRIQPAPDQFIYHKLFNILDRYASACEGGSPS